MSPCMGVSPPSTSLGAGSEGARGQFVAYPRRAPMTNLSISVSALLGYALPHMVRDRDREAWERDLEARQRNIVPPDTIANEARFWRNLTSGKASRAKAVYVAIYFLTAVGLALALMSGQLEELRQAGLPWWKRVIAVGGEGAVVFLVVGGLLLLIRWRANKVTTRPRAK